METTLKSLVELVNAGDKDALEELVRSIQDRIYGLAIRMLYQPADAEDATQEILVKVITRLDSFRGESSFTTWVYRVASNHLLTTHKRRAERLELNFEKYEDLIDEGLSETMTMDFNEAEERLIIKETKLACMQGMLLCMNRDIRIAFILGEVIGMTSAEGGEILDITPDLFRQRLSRGRKRLQEFLANNCGLFNPANKCHCAKILAYDIDAKRIDPENLLFATHPCRDQQNGKVSDNLEELDELRRVAALFRGHPDYSAPETFVDTVKRLVHSGRFQFLTA